MGILAHFSFVIILTWKIPGVGTYYSCQYFLQLDERLENRLFINLLSMRIKLHFRERCRSALHPGAASSGITKSRSHYVLPGKDMNTLLAIDAPGMCNAYSYHKLTF